MKEKKTYYSPNIIEIDLDSEISLVLASDENPPSPPDDQEPLGGASTTSSFEEKESTSSFEDTPFK